VFLKSVGNLWVGMGQTARFGFVSKWLVPLYGLGKHGKVAIARPRGTIESRL
jgi:hypothetical protein